ncbi:alpha/beta fold hydrolase, partial [Pseudoalteromonas luteoviolacea]
TLNDEEFITQLQAELTRVLPSYMLPHTVTVIAQWPMTVNGKVDQKALRDLATNTLLNKGIETPKTNMEKALCDLWSEVLCVPSSSLNMSDNFFEVGGNSLLLIKLLERLHAQIGTQVGVEAIYNAQTIREQAQILEGKNSVLPASVMGQYTGTRPTVFLIPGLLSTINLFSRFGAHLNEEGFDCVALRYKYERTLAGEVSSIEAHAQMLAEQALKYCGSQKVIICGHSYGGAVAYELALILQQQNVDSEVVLLESYFEQSKYPSRVIENNELSAEVGITESEQLAIAREYAVCFENYFPSQKWHKPLFCVWASDAIFDAECFEESLKAKVTPQIISTVVNGNHISIFDEQNVTDLARFVRNMFL